MVPIVIVSGLLFVSNSGLKKSKANVDAGDVPVDHGNIPTV